MKKIPIFIFIIWLFSVSVFAQRAEKVDEFYSFAQCDDYISRLDNFAVHLQNNPKSAGVAIFYEGKYWNRLPIFGEVQNRIQKVRLHYKYRKFENRSILYINGGFRESAIIELWIVPKGAKFPKPTPTLNIMKYRKGVLDKSICGDNLG